MQGVKPSVLGAGWLLLPPWASVNWAHAAPPPLPEGEWGEPFLQRSCQCLAPGRRKARQGEGWAAHFRVTGDHWAEQETLGLCQALVSSRGGDSPVGPRPAGQAGQVSRDFPFTHSRAGSWCTVTGPSPVLDASQGEGDAGPTHTAPVGLLSHTDTGPPRRSHYPKEKAL